MQEDDDLEELLSDGDNVSLSNGVLGKISENRSAQKLNDSGQLEPPIHKQPKTGYPLLNALETFLKESEHQGASVAGMGSEINGLTISGLTVQTASLMGLVGIKSIGELIDYIERAREKEQAEKLEQILEQIDSLDARTERVATRAKHVDVMGNIEAIDARAEKLAERAGQILERPAVAEPEDLEKSVPQSNRAFEAKETKDIQIGNSEAKASQISEKIDELESKLNPASQKSQPLELDKNSSISEQLDQIQDYLGKLSQPLDRLESIVEKQEQKMARQRFVESESIIHSKAAKTPQEVQPSVPTPTNVSDEESEPEDLLSKMVAQTKARQQRETVADCLVNYAFATGQSPQSGIAFDGGGSLYVTAQGNEVKVGSISLLQKYQVES